MDNMDWYQGKAIKSVVEATGRTPTTLQYLVAAYMRALEEGVTIYELENGMLKDIADFHPTKRNPDDILKELNP